MKFALSILPSLALLPAVFGDGGLRAMGASDVRRLGFTGPFDDEAAWQAAIYQLIAPNGNCDLFQENFEEPCGDTGVGPDTDGEGCQYPALKWETTDEGGGDESKPFDTRIEGGKFLDRVARDIDDATFFKYPALEAFGFYVDLDPDGLGQGLSIKIYADGQFLNDVTAVTTGGRQFYGIISTEPIKEIMIKAGNRPRTQETYEIDTFFIFPWCTEFPNGYKGDPHVETWLGDYFDFMGQCDVVFLQDKAHDIDIHARTTIRYDYSYVESAAVRIGEDVLEVSSFGEHFINGVDMADNVGSGASYTVGGYPVYYSMKNKRTHQFDIVLGEEKNITIGTFKDLVSVSTKGAEAISYFEQSTGIMGNVYGHLLGRDGETEYKIKDQKDMDAFGQEWQVGAEEPKLFQTDRAPQYPAKCIFPSDEVKEGRRLSESPIELNAAEMACARFAGATFQKCVYDVMAFGDLEVAESGIY